MNCPYTAPEIKKYANDDWCVEYYYQYPKEWPQFPGMKRIKVREGINYIKDPKEKEEKIVELKKVVETALRDLKYNPFDDILEKQQLIDEENKRIAQEEEDKRQQDAKMRIQAAFDWFLLSKKKIGLAKRTLEGYDSYLKNFKLWIDAYNLNPANEKYEQIEDITAEVIEKYLEESSDNAEWKPRTYNNNLKGLITVFSYLKKKKKIPVNPLSDGVIEAKTTRAERNKYYSKSLRRLIQPELDRQPYLNLFIRWVYYSCARINELIRLRVSDIDLDLRKIKVPAEVGKTGEHVGDRTIPICEELYDLIIEMKISEYPLNYYIFTKNLEPGPEMIPDDYFRDIYLPIKRRLRLDINYTMYSFKHTRVVDLLAAGFAPQLVMFLTGHTDWTSFQKYCRELGAVIDIQLTGKTIGYN